MRARAFAARVSRARGAMRRRERYEMAEERRKRKDKAERRKEACQSAPRVLSRLFSARPWREEAVAVWKAGSLCYRRRRAVHRYELH